jgi:hypothetical protein
MMWRKFGSGPPWGLAVMSATILAATSGASAGSLTMKVIGIHGDVHGDGGMVFDENGFYGNIEFSADPNTLLDYLFANGNGEDFSPNVKIQEFTGSILFEDGWVKGGDFTFAVKGDDGDPNDWEWFGASFLADSGKIIKEPQGGDFVIDGEIFDGFFQLNGDGSFSGVDLGDFAFLDDIAGLFSVLHLNPSDDKDNNIDMSMETQILIPLPAGGAMGLAGLMALGTIRKRR